jgi:hypothetical protein
MCYVVFENEKVVGCDRTAASIFSRTHRVRAVKSREGESLSSAKWTESSKGNTARLEMRYQQEVHRNEPVHTVPANTGQTEQTLHPSPDSTQCTHASVQLLLLILLSGSAGGDGMVKRSVVRADQGGGLRWVTGRGCGLWSRRSWGWE